MAFAVTVYDRTTLVDKAIATVKTNLREGAILVIAICSSSWEHSRRHHHGDRDPAVHVVHVHRDGHLQGERESDESGRPGLLGIIIDGAVVIVENCVRRRTLGRCLAAAHALRTLPRSLFASKESRRALLFGQLIIMVVYLPIFARWRGGQNVPSGMAFTVVAALRGDDRDR